MKKSYILLSLVLAAMSCKTDNEPIIFSSGRNGNSDIFMMDINGNNQIPLTQNTTEEWAPTWINENEITFLRQQNDSIVRVKLNLVTKGETKLEHPSNCILDDKNVLYSISNHYQLYACKGDIFIFDTKTNETTNITEKLNGTSLYPCWSNDGKSIIYTSNHLGTNEIFIFEMESQETTQLTDSDSNNERGELSPNRELLVYSSDFFEKGNQDVVVRNLETGEIKNVSNSSGMELIARFSANGEDIFYGSNKDGNWEIYSYNLATGNQIRLTTNMEFDGDPRILKR